MRRVALIGLDCAAPAVMFDRYRSEMPALSALMGSGAFGPLRSCHPPITVPAWASMLTGRDPGELGIYGFRNRRTAAYGPLRVASSKAVTQPGVWDVFAAEEGRAILLGIPPSYPALPVQGSRVSCLLTPANATQTTWPPELAAEIDRIAPDYAYDVGDFRGAEPSDLLARLRAKTENHFRVARHLLQTQAWDFFAMVEMGPDRLHHALWRFIDPTHPAHVPGTATEDDVVAYFRMLDARLGELLDVIGSDAVVVVASDHGAQTMRGGVCVNEWLRRHGYLVLYDVPDRPSALRPEWVDWGRTTAWAEGGYYARIFLNRRGREPLGRVDADATDAVLGEIVAGLQDIVDADGCRVGVEAHRPCDLYRATEGCPPDLLVYFGELAWRSLAVVGGGATVATENDSGADDANHAFDGIFVMRDPRESWAGERLRELELLDVGATLLDRGDLDAAATLPGRPIGSRNAGSADVGTAV